MNQFLVAVKIDKCGVFQNVKEEFFKVDGMIDNCCKNARFFGSLARSGIATCSQIHN